MICLFHCPFSASTDVSRIDEGFMNHLATAFSSGSHLSHKTVFEGEKEKNREERVTGNDGNERHGHSLFYCSRFGFRTHSSSRSNYAASASLLT